MSDEYKNSFYNLSLSLKEQDFDTLDAVAAYALQKAIDAKEWAKNNLIVI